MCLLEFNIGEGYCWLYIVKYINNYVFKFVPWSFCVKLNTLKLFTRMKHIVNYISDSFFKFSNNLYTFESPIFDNGIHLYSYMMATLIICPTVHLRVIVTPPPKIIHKLYYMLIPNNVHSSSSYYLLSFFPWIITKNIMRRIMGFFSNASDSRAELQNFFTQKIGLWTSKVGVYHCTK